MKKLVGASILVVVVIVAAIFIFNAIDKPTDDKKASNNSGNEIILTPQEVAKHSSTSDCWFVINNKVYNVSGFSTNHPGGDAAIAANCGKDATNAFQAKGGKGTHSPNAQSMLSNFYLGDLNQKIVQ